MTPAQRSDDPARGLRSIWLGPENAWRWPFDATFTEWAVGFAAFWCSWFVLWFILPLGVPMVGLSVLFGRLLGKYAPIKALDVHRHMSPRFYGLLMLTLMLLLFPHPHTWLMPLSWWAAFFWSFPAAMFIVRWARPHIDHNRPVRYWFRTWHRVANGPRPRRRLAEAALSPLAVHAYYSTDNDVALTQDDDVVKTLLTVATINMEEVPVQRYHRVVEVEAMEWNSRSGLAATSFEVLAWLRSHNVPLRIEKARYRPTILPDGREVEVLASAILYVNDERVNDGATISRDLDTGALRIYQPNHRDAATFRDTHVPIAIDRSGITGRRAETEVQA